MDIIIYGSLHGAAKRYAEGLAERTGLKAVDYKEVDSLGLYKRVIYIGAIYASGVTGLKKTVAKLTQNQELFVAPWVWSIQRMKPSLALFKRL